MPEYIKFKFDTKKEGLDKSQITLYPIVCAHLGSAQCDMKFIKTHIARIKADPNARWIYMGDMGECVTKLSKGDVYQQLLSPQGQQDLAVELFSPIVDKGLFGIRGNHGHRIYKETGLSFDKTLCHRLGLPYLGASTFVNLIVNRSSYDLYFHHGVDSGVTINAKVTSHEKFNKFIDADAIFTAHSHLAQELQPAILYQADNNACKIRSKLRHGYICGAAYDGRAGYGEDKGYTPMLPAWVSVRFDGRIIQGEPQKTQKYEVYRSSGQYDLTHEYIDSMRENELV